MKNARFEFLSDAQADNPGFSEELLQCSPDCVKILDASAHVRFFNRNGLCAMEFDDFSQVAGVYWPMLWPAEDRPVLEAALASARTLGTASFIAACPTAKGTPRWWDVIVNTIPDPSNGELRFVVTSRDVTERRRLEEVERQQHDRLQSILAASSDVLWDIDLIEDKVWWSESMQSTFGYGRQEIGESTQWCLEHIHPEDRDRIKDSMAAAIEHGEASWQGEFRYRKSDGHYLDVLDRGSILRDQTGKAVRFVGIMQDNSSRKAQETRQDLLARELAHRANNMLAVISSLMQQTLRTSENLKAFGDNFGRRLIAMANANGVLVRSGSAGADLLDLATTQLRPFMQAERISLQGPPISLSLDVAQPVALALNELATNATKYGSLSVPQGIVRLDWSTHRRDEAASLLISWREEGGPVASKPSREGFGSRLIDRGIPDAKVDRIFAPSGLRCTIELPAGRFRADAAGLE